MIPELGHNPPSARPATHEEIDERTEEMEKEDNQRPDNLLGAIESSVRQGVDQHPDPEDGEEERDDQSKETDSRQEAGGILDGIGEEESVHRFASSIRNSLRLWPHAHGLVRYCARG